MTALLPLVEDTLLSIEDFAAEKGVDIDLHLSVDEHGTFIYLGRIDRATGLPGSGRQVIERLCEIADELQSRIKLAVLSWNSTLIDYYSDFGFELTHFPKFDDVSDHAEMERPPS